MKVSESWLREWVNPPQTGVELAAKLTMAGLEVDGVHSVAGAFHHVVVAQVLRTSPHPQADKLTLCEIDIGSSVPVNVVCGAANVRPGLKVALALPGAHLPNGLKIQATMLRGQPSNGMLCSTTELGMEESAEGIMELPEDAPLGSDLRDYLGLNDQVFDIDLTPNRADCFSVLGVAREVAAIYHVPLRAIPDTINKVAINDRLSVVLHAKEACPQYLGRIIRQIHPEAITPTWMKERLRRAGVRALHPVVDVTNYVMLELGQPMHAFDLQSIKGEINVRYAHKNETLRLLDGQQVTLEPNVLVIADHTQPLAIAGIMGGEASAVQTHTTDIFLESAFFNPITIAGVARRYGLSTDSSQRFERGVDSKLQAVALERATELLLTIVGGQAGPITLINHPDTLPSSVSISFHPAKVKQLTGVEVSEDKMLAFLKALGMQVTVSQKKWQVIPPSHRFDIVLEVDLVEEIIRLHGFDNIKAEPLLMHGEKAKENIFERVLNQATHFLCARGYHEAINYSFVDPELQRALYPEAQGMPLLNPISSELSVMRVGMWPGLLASLVYNMHRQQEAIRFFEAGVVFDVQRGGLQERACIAGLASGERGYLNWSEPARTFDFFDVKGDLQSLFHLLHTDKVEFVSKEHPALHPGQSAQMMLGTTEVGWLGVLHPRWQDELQLNNDVVLFEIFLQPFFDPHSVRFQPISKYPQIRRDLSLLVDNEISVSEIERAVREVVPTTWLKSFDIFDVYSGSSIPNSKKSIAMALTLQDDRRTLVDGEINNMIDAILNILNDKFAILLRE